MAIKKYGFDRLSNDKIKYFKDLINTHLDCNGSIYGSIDIQLQSVKIIIFNMVILVIVHKNY